ncbi:MAG: glycosyltransferase [Anaerolineales bacterium]|nr:glycosyltransferase [Anaerolineales bacterium]
MRITLLTYGSRGDVEPFVALGVGFMRAGHSVRLAAPVVFEQLVSSHGVDFVGLPGNPDGLVQDLVDKAGKNYVRMIRVMSKFVVPIAVGVLDQVRFACENTDIIIHSFLLTNTGHEIAREKGVHDFSAQFFPVFSTTAEFPGIVFPDLPLGNLYRRLTHEFITQTFWQGSRVLYGWIRRSNKHLPPLTDWPFAARSDHRTPILYAFSPSVLPQPADWGEDVHVTGYWFTDDRDWHPPQKLLDFLDSGSKPIAIAFGSTSTRSPEQMANVIRGALALSGQRAVIVGAENHFSDLPGTVFQLDSAPYGWLFARMSAVVHHGGAGTTGAGLMAGVPNIITPFTSDQPFWGHRVHSLGAGPKPLPAKKLTAQALAESIIGAVDDQNMRARAKAIGARIRTEDGVSRAVDIVLRHVEAGA